LVITFIFQLFVCPFQFRHTHENIQFPKKKIFRFADSQALESEWVDVKKKRAVIIIFMADNLICHNHRHRRDEHKNFFMSLFSASLRRAYLHIHLVRHRPKKSLINDGNYNAWRIFNAAPDELLLILMEKNYVLFNFM